MSGGRGAAGKSRRWFASARERMNRREPPREAAALFSTEARAAALRFPDGAYALKAMKRAALFGEHARLGFVALATMAAMRKLIGGGACRA